MGRCTPITYVPKQRLGQQSWGACGFQCGVLYSEGMSSTHSHFLGLSRRGYC